MSDLSVTVEVKKAELARVTKMRDQFAAQEKRMHEDAIANQGAKKAADYLIAELEKEISALEQPAPHIADTDPVADS